VHLFIYNIFLIIYSIGIRISSLWNPKARLWLRGRRNLWEELEGIGRQKAESERSEGKRPKPGSEPENAAAPQTSAGSAAEGAAQYSPLVWMHCSSLGEFEQGRPVLEAIRHQYPTAKILLTFFSPSGYEVRKNNSGADYVMYLPLDSKANARRFINTVQPDLVIWIKYEYWFYYLTELKKKQIPLLLVSGIFRNDQPFFKW